jgi:hypothetical protein
MPQCVNGMCLVGHTHVLGLDIRPGCRVKVLAASDPSYDDPEAEGTDPVPMLSEADIAFWQGVLDRQR